MEDLDLQINGGKKVLLICENDYKSGQGSEF